MPLTRSTRGFYARERDPRGGMVSVVALRPDVCHEWGRKAIL
jgi:hypothetical protein